MDAPMTASSGIDLSDLGAVGHIEGDAGIMGASGEENGDISMGQADAESGGEGDAEAGPKDEEMADLFGDTEGHENDARYIHSPFALRASFR